MKENSEKNQKKNRNIQIKLIIMIIIIKKKEDKYKDEFVILETDMENGEEELFNIINDIKSKHFEIIKNICFFLFFQKKLVII